MAQKSLWCALYAVLMGLEIEGKVEVGAVYFPALDEMLYVTGMGCYLNGRQVQVSPVNSLDKAITYTDGLSFEVFGKKAQWQHLQSGFMLVEVGQMPTDMH